MKVKKKFIGFFIAIIAVVCLASQNSTIVNMVNNLQKQQDVKVSANETELKKSYEKSKDEKVQDQENQELVGLTVDAYFEENGGTWRGIYKKFTKGYGVEHYNEYATLKVKITLSQENVYIEDGKIELSSDRKKF